MAQLQLDLRLPEGRRTCERLLEDVGLQPVQEDQEDRTCKQFVFEGQCLVLGESEVGKTSLVKSLTGKPFDLEQPKTQGIDQSLVNEKWQNLEPKDLVFGNFSRFFKTAVQLTVFRKAVNVIVQESTNFPERWFGLFLISLIFTYDLLYCLVGDLQFLLFLLPCVLHIASIIVATGCISHSESTRFIIAIAWSFIGNYLGLLIGAFLSIPLEPYLSGMSVVDRRFFRLLIIHALLLLLAQFSFLFFHQPSFGVDIKCRYPGQLNVKKQGLLEILFISRFVITVTIGYTCFTILMTFVADKTKLTSQLTLVVVICCQLLLLLQSVPRVVKSVPGWRYKAIFIFAIICFHCVGVLLPLNVYSVITFLIFCCDTVHKEYSCITSAVATIVNDHEGTSNFTAVCIEKAAMNERNLQNLRDTLNEKFSSLKLKILDFAGDQEYQAYYHMFLRSQAIYVIVFNMAKFAENSFKDIHTKIRTLHLWFESVCSYVPPKTPILLVGTHRGNMNKICMKSLNGHLKRSLWPLL